MTLTQVRRRMMQRSSESMKLFSIGGSIRRPFHFQPHSIVVALLKLSLFCIILNHCRIQIQSPSSPKFNCRRERQKRGGAQSRRVHAEYSTKAVLHLRHAPGFPALFVSRISVRRRVRGARHGAAAGGTIRFSTGIRCNITSSKASARATSSSTWRWVCF